MTGSFNETQKIGTSDGMNDSATPRSVADTGLMKLIKKILDLGWWMENVNRENISAAADHVIDTIGFIQVVLASFCGVLVLMWMMSVHFVLWAAMMISHS